MNYKYLYKSIKLRNKFHIMQKSITNIYITQLQASIAGGDGKEGKSRRGLQRGG